MPIGLPERIIGPGRGPEQAIRPLLGERQSSVFSIPARAAVEAVDPWPSGMAALRTGHAEASRIARAFSDPPRGVSFQGFNLFPKIRALDRALRAREADRARIFETHPEAIFATLRGSPCWSRKRSRARSIHRHDRTTRPSDPRRT